MESIFLSFCLPTLPFFTYFKSIRMTNVILPLFAATCEDSLAALSGGIPTYLGLETFCLIARRVAGIENALNGNGE